LGVTVLTLFHQNFCFHSLHIASSCHWTGNNFLFDTLLGKYKKSYKFLHPCCNKDIPFYFLSIYPVFNPTDLRIEKQTARYRTTLVHFLSHAPTAHLTANGSANSLSHTAHPLASGGRHGTAYAMPCLL
jgi:hypothetical protein